MFLEKENPFSFLKNENRCILDLTYASRWSEVYQRRRQFATYGPAYLLKYPMFWKQVKLLKLNLFDM